jgi:hypothetical protein
MRLELQKSVLLEDRQVWHEAEAESWQHSQMLTWPVKVLGAIVDAKTCPKGPYSSETLWYTVKRCLCTGERGEVCSLVVIVLQQR